MILKKDHNKYKQCMFCGERDCFLFSQEGSGLVYAVRICKNCLKKMIEMIEEVE